MNNNWINVTVCITNITHRKVSTNLSKSKINRTRGADTSGPIESRTLRFRVAGKSRRKESAWGDPVTLGNFRWEV